MPIERSPADLLAPAQQAVEPVTSFFGHVVAAVEALPMERIATALGVFLLCLALRWPIRHVILFLIVRTVGITSKDLRTQIADALRQPVGLLPVVLGVFFAFEILKVDESGIIARISKEAVATLLILAAYWALFALVEPLITYLRPRQSHLTAPVADWIRNALKCLVAFFALAAILQQWGVRVGPMLTGLGIVGAAAALGSQALFKNLISGVLILMEQRFQYGDWVKVPNVVEGTVESIGFGSTKIRQFDDAAVQVPNSDLADNAVINYTRMRRRRIYWLIGVPYSTTVDQLRVIRDGIETYIHECADFVPYKQASTFVRIDSFGQSSINIMVYCFTRTTNWGEWLLVKERLAYKIMDIVLGAGSSFAFPSTSLYVESMPHDQPDLFLPPEGDQPRIEAAVEPPPAATGAVGRVGPADKGELDGAPGEGQG